MPLVRCLRCRRLARRSPCPTCVRDAKQVRNADRPIAKAVVAGASRCARCGATEDLTAEHILPLARGGTNGGRRRVLCRSCNSRKRDR